MSLDLILESRCDVCGEGSIKYEGNVTYNFSPMWFDMFPDDKNLLPLDGMNGRQALSKLTDAVDQMLIKKKRMLELEPSNGWGSYQGFLGFVRELRAASEDNLDCIWRSER